jgi:predicted acyltransferase
MTATEAAPRLVSLDQFRGYTVLGMLLVNFVGSFALVRSELPVLAHHHTYCSYADTIMPQFLFAVGFAFRLTFARRLQTIGPRAAYLHAIRRNLGLLLVAFVVYAVGSRWENWADLVQRDKVILRWAKQDLFQTLAHIAVTSLWVLPVIAARPGTRFVYALFSGVLHFALSYWFYYRWTNTPPNGVDGGPLGFLTWSIPLLFGTLACDVYQATPSRARLARLYFVAGVGVMLFAYGLSCLHLAPSDMDDWHFNVATARASVPLVEVPVNPQTGERVKPPTNDLFAMSQRSGAVTYPLFGAGVSLAVLALFVFACDIGGLRVGVFGTFGANALAAYILHELVFSAVKPFVPKDAPLWYVFSGCIVALAVCYVIMRNLEKNKLFLKL